jgi:hypothetical protein
MMSMDTEAVDDEATLTTVQTIESLHRHYNQSLSAYDLVGISVYRELNRRRALAVLENEITAEIVIDIISQRLIAGTHNLLNDLSIHDDLRNELSDLLFNHGTVEETAPVQEPRVLPPLILCMTPEDCSICLNSITPEEMLYDIPCGHFFHQSCLSKWLDRQPSCPLCRANI